MVVLDRNKKILLAVFLLFNAVFLPISTTVVNAQVGNVTNATNATNTSDSPQLSSLTPNNSSSDTDSPTLVLDGDTTNATNTTNTTNTTNATNGSDSPTLVSSGDGGGGGGKCGVANPDGCIPSVGDLIGGAIEYVVGGITDNLKKLVQGFSDMIVGLPAPGDGWDVSTWPNPQNGWWPGIYKAYAVFSAISISLLGLAFMYAYESTDPYTRRKRLKRLAIHAVMIIFGAVIIIPASLHFFDTLAQAVAPSADEFFSTPGNLGKLGVGAILGGGLIFAQSSIILVGIGVLLAIFVAIHFLAAFWPLFWLARLAPISSVEWVGNAGISAFYALCVMRVLQSAFLRVMFSLPWNPVTSGAGSAVAALIMTVIGLYIAFITVPKAFSKKAIPGVQMLSSNTPSSEDIREGYTESRQRIGDVKGRMEEVRGGGTENKTPTHKREVGEVQGSRDWNDAGGSSASTGSGSGSGSASASGSSSGRSGVEAGEWDNQRYNVNKAANKGYQ